MQKTKTKKRTALIVALSVVSGLLLVSIIMLTIMVSINNNSATALEQIYQKNMYELIDNINNTEVKLSKALSSADSGYQAKMLREVSYNTDMAQTNLNNLPYTLDGLNESIGFVNQVSGYSETLAINLEQGGELSSSQLSTLEKVYDTVLTMKNSLAKFSENMWNDYSILSASNTKDGDNNAFTKQIGLVKEINVEYPTMIYDGPFSDSVVNKKVEGLSVTKVSKETAKENLLKCFSNYTEEQVEYKGETKGKFETFDFVAKNSEGKQIAYIQLTQQGGNLLTASSMTDNKGENISMETAKETALNFVKKSGIESVEVVWSDKLEGNAYINIATVVNDVILYPDLIKVKVDMSNGNILGYEASSYYTNHKDRSIPKLSNVSANKSKIEKKYTVKSSRFALIPLDFNREVLCQEYACKLGNDEYYFYYNVETGALENVLKVIKTNNGNLLM